MTNVSAGLSVRVEGTVIEFLSVRFIA